MARASGTARARVGSTSWIREPPALSRAIFIREGTTPLRRPAGREPLLRFLNLNIAVFGYEESGCMRHGAHSGIRDSQARTHLFRLPFDAWGEA